MDVFTMLLIVLCIANPMVSKAFFLPYERPECQFLPDPEGKSAFDVLTDFFQRDVSRGRDDQMEVVRHNHKLMQEIAALATIVLKDVEKQSCHFLFPEKRTPSVRDGRDKKCADFLRSVFHFPPALKRIILNDLYAALKGRSSTKEPQLTRRPSRKAALLCCTSIDDSAALLRINMWMLRPCHIFVICHVDAPATSNLFSSRFSAKNRWKNGPSGPCKGMF
jgi:hypothetical protein